MRDVLEESVALVGPGRAGRAFARSWSAGGGRIAHVIVREPRRAVPGLAGAEVYTVDAARLPGCDILVLAVPDDAIGSVAARLAGRLACRFAFHLSGALGSDALTPLRQHGAAVGSLHPLRPFTGAEEENWQEAFIAVEGDPGATEIGERIASVAGGHPYRLTASGKPLYHAAASLAAGGTAAVLSVAVRACVAAGIPEEVARQALAGLASRATAAASRQPFSEAFTGAVARRDLGTVRAHVGALSAHPDALRLYLLLADEILKQTPGRGKEREILEALGGSTRAPDRTIDSS